MKREGITRLNNTDEAPLDVARSREAATQQRSISEAASRGRVPDLAPSPEIGEDLELEQAIASGSKRVMVPERRESWHRKFGHESKHPRGTFVREDGSPCLPGEVAFGVIGDLLTPQGRLINRIIPFESLGEVS